MQKLNLIQKGPIDFSEVLLITTNDVDLINRSICLSIEKCLETGQGSLEFKLNQNILSDRKFNQFFLGLNYMAYDASISHATSTVKVGIPLINYDLDELTAHAMDCSENERSKYIFTVIK